MAIAANALRDKENNKFGDWGDTTPAVKILAKEFDTVPTDSSKNNPSFAYSYDSDDNLTRIEMVIDGTTYKKDFAWSGNNLTNETAWIEV